MPFGDTTNKVPEYRADNRSDAQRLLDAMKYREFTNILDKIESRKSKIESIGLPDWGAGAGFALSLPTGGIASPVSTILGSGAGVGLENLLKYLFVPKDPSMKAPEIRQEQNPDIFAPITQTGETIKQGLPAAALFALTSGIPSAASAIKKTIQTKSPSEVLKSIFSKLPSEIKTASKTVAEQLSDFLKPLESKIPMSGIMAGKKAKSPLHAEARKFKSAEEFAKSKPIIYHGTNQDIKSFSKGMLGKMTKAQGAREGFFFTDSLEEAKGYAINASKREPSNVRQHEIKVNKLLKKIELAEANRNFDLSEKLTSQLEDLELEAINEPVGTNVKVYEVYADLKNPLVLDMKGTYPYETGLTNILQKAKKDGYDGVVLNNISDSAIPLDKPTNQTVVFDAKNIKTKSQLTSIWNEANKK